MGASVASMVTGLRDHAVLLGALLVDPEVANHLTDVPKFDIVELGQVRWSLLL